MITIDMFHFKVIFILIIILLTKRERERMFLLLFLVVYQFGIKNLKFLFKQKLIGNETFSLDVLI